MSYLLGTSTPVITIPETNIDITTSNLPYLFTAPVETNESDVPTDTVSYSPALQTRTLKVTVETLLKNIASYNYKTDMSDKKYHIKTYYLDDNKIIKIVVDMKDSKHIIYTISGDTGYDKTLIKDIVISDNEIITTYLEGEDNET